MHSSRSPLSLKARALAYLARREHSRLELEKKLRGYAESAEQLQHLLDQLEAQKLLSLERYAESLMHRKAGRLGAQRILAEMKQQGLDENLRAASAVALKETELERATAVWKKRYGAVSIPLTWQEKNKQANKQAAFLQRRGFSMEIIRKILKSAFDTERLDASDSE